MPSVNGVGAGTLSAKWRPEKPKTCIFLGKFDPSRQLYWLAERGGMVRKSWTFAPFWLSANSLPWQDAPPAIAYLRRGRLSSWGMNFTSLLLLSKHVNSSVSGARPAAPVTVI